MKPERGPRPRSQRHHTVGEPRRTGPSSEGSWLIWSNFDTAILDNQRSNEIALKETDPLVDLVAKPVWASAVDAALEHPELMFAGLSATLGAVTGHSELVVLGVSEAVRITMRGEHTAHYAARSAAFRKEVKWTKPEFEDHHRWESTVRHRVDLPR